MTEIKEIYKSEKEYLPYVIFVMKKAKDSRKERSIMIGEDEYYIDVERDMIKITEYGHESYTAALTFDHVDILFNQAGFNEEIPLVPLKDTMIIIYMEVPTGITKEGITKAGKLARFLPEFFESHPFQGYVKAVSEELKEEYKPGDVVFINEGLWESDLSSRGCRIIKFNGKTYHYIYRLQAIAKVK